MKVFQRNSSRFWGGYAGETPVEFHCEVVDRLIAAGMRYAVRLSSAGKPLQTRIQKLATETAGSGVVARVITVEFLE